MKPKIIFTVTNDVSYDQRMIRIATTLAANGFSVTLVGRIRPNSIPLKTQPFQQKRLPLFFQKGKLFYVEYNLRLFFFLLTHPKDIIGSIDLDTLLPCFLVAKIQQKPIVFDAHEYFTEVPEVVDRPFTKKVWRFLGNWIIPKLNYAYTVSASLQEIFTQKYGVPFQLIRNIASKKKYEQAAAITAVDTRQPIILYQGVLNEGRGLPEMITAMTIINNAQFWLAGEGDLSQVLRKQVQVAQLEEKVKFLGYLSPDDLQAVTLQATIGLNLIENKGLSYYYSLANKTFDYMHAGIPAIHCNFPEYQAIMREYEIGLLVNDLQPATLAQAVNTLLVNRTFYQNLQENCETASKYFTWEKESEKLIAFYQQIQ